MKGNMRTPTEILTDLQAAVAEVERLQGELSDAMRINSATVKDKAIAMACKVWEVAPSQITNGCKQQRKVYARWFAWKLMEMNGYEAEEIGKSFNRCRATIYHGLRSLNNLLETDKQIQEKWKMV